MVSIEIDGIKCEAAPGTKVIEAADALGVNIPRFCYHQKLSVAANCRMCLVEVAGSPKPLPACATPVAEGMKVFTTSPKAREAQRAVMEFLLINHPLDCPVCDQGGECELQDVSLEYGDSVSRYLEAKRTVKSEDIGPLIATEMTRCIHCTRCVRFGTEIAGVRELGATGRGEHMEIGTFLPKNVDSELSGNVIDICPVGALTSKPYRFSARAWELHQHAGISPHDCVGSHLYFHVASNQVKRVVPKACETINEVWLSDRDRFGYLGVHSKDRLLKPRIRDAKGWSEATWEQAFDCLRERLVGTAPNEMGGLISPSSTLEECFLFQKFLRELGCANIDHRIHQLDFSDEGMPSNLFGMKIADLLQLESVLLIGSNSRKEQPLLNHRIRKASLQGCNVVCINPIAYDFNFEVKQIIPEAGALQLPLLQLAKAIFEVVRALDPQKVAKVPIPLFEKGDDFLSHPLKKGGQGGFFQEFAKTFVQKSKKAIFLGPQALHHPQAGVLRELAFWIAEVISATLAELPVGTNSGGARLAGVVPYVGPGGLLAPQKGLNAYQMLEKKLKAYFLFNLEPEYDSVNPALFYDALKGASCVVAAAAYLSPWLEEHAHVLLPVATPCETSGTFVNVEGKWQSFQPAIPPLGEARPGWKILNAMGEWFAQKGFGYKTSEAVKDELLLLVSPVEKGQPSVPPFGKEPAQHLLRGGLGGILSKVEEGGVHGDIWVSERAMYAVDGIVRHSDALQQTEDARLCHFARVNEATAKKYALLDGEAVLVKSKRGTAALVLKVDKAIPDRVVYIPQGIAQVVHLGAPYQSVQLLKRENLG